MEEAAECIANMSSLNKVVKLQEKVLKYADIAHNFFVGLGDKSVTACQIG